MESCYIFQGPRGRGGVKNFEVWGQVFHGWPLTPEPCKDTTAACKAKLAWRVLRLTALLILARLAASGSHREPFDQNLFLDIRSNFINSCSFSYRETNGTQPLLLARLFYLYSF